MTTKSTQAEQLRERTRALAADRRAFVTYNDSELDNAREQSRAVVRVRSVARATRRVSVEQRESDIENKRSRASEQANYSRVAPRARKRSHDDDTTSRVAYCFTCDRVYSLSLEHASLCEHLRDFSADEFDFESDALEMISECSKRHAREHSNESFDALERAFAYARKVIESNRTKIRGRRNVRASVKRCCATCFTQLPATNICSYCD